jgi:hypothetical protein
MRRCETKKQGWKIFQAFEKHCRLPGGGYASIRDVDELPVRHEDRMETFWIVSPSCSPPPPLLPDGRRDYDVLIIGPPPLPSLKRSSTCTCCSRTLT